MRVPMRTDCRHYESRTYEGGEVVRKCRLDLAPEAPWRCPDDCPRYERRRMDAGWQYGSLSNARAEPERADPTGDEVAALLDQAEAIVNSAAPDILSEFAKQEAKQSKKGRLRRKKKKK